MARSTKILEGVEVQSLASGLDVKSASLESRSGFLAELVEFSIKDDSGSLNPFTTKGLLASQPWRDTTVEQSDGGQTLFVGTLKNLEYSTADRQLKVVAAEDIVTLLKFYVEDGEVYNQDPTTLLTSGSIDGDHSSGDNSIELSGITGTIPTGSFVSFGDSIVPRYLILETIETGGNTTEIILDRGLASQVLGGTSLRIISPAVKGPAQALKDTLEAAGLSARLDNSFDDLIAKEAALGLKIWINVRVETRLRLGEYLDRLLTMANLYLINMPNRRIGIVRGFLYQNNQTYREELRPSEIIPPIKCRTDDSKLVYGFSAFYLDGTSAKLANYIDETAFRSWKAREVWTPIEGGSPSLVEYPLLYGDRPSAVWFADSYLQENKAPRHLIEFGLKGVDSESLSRRSVQLGGRYRVTADLGLDGRLNAEPVAVYGFQKNEKGSFFPSVVMQYTNFPTGIPRTEVETRRIKVPDSIVLGPNYHDPLVRGVATGAALIFDYIGSGDLDVQVFDHSLQVLTFEGTFTRAAGDIEIETTALEKGGPLDFLTFADAALLDGSTYYLKARTSSGKFRSSWSRPFKFKPAAGVSISAGDLSGEL